MMNDHILLYSCNPLGYMSIFMFSISKTKNVTNVTLHGDSIMDLGFCILPDPPQHLGWEEVLLKLSRCNVTFVTFFVFDMENIKTML